MMQSVISFAARGGRVLGVCNGFQILCEAGLLPGVLLRNAGMQFVCRNVHVRGRDGQVHRIPVAHGEGRFHADAATMQAIERNGQVIYRYCDAEGRETPAANPNGSTSGIAGIRNEAGNVFGMMPHPERACSGILGNTDGQRVFRDLLGV
jgi:phosphoribosylformylglycinamidine synthase